MLFESRRVELAALEAAELEGFKHNSAFKDALTKSGHLVGCNPLQPNHTATTVRVRVRNGTVSTTDGPFAETREQLGGYFLIEARDLNDAIQVASKIPSARLGSIEVRPVGSSSSPRLDGRMR
jgi:hypothetical protein